MVDIDALTKTLREVSLQSEALEGANLDETISAFLHLVRDECLSSQTGELLSDPASETLLQIMREADDETRAIILQDSALVILPALFRIVESIDDRSDDDDRGAKWLIDLVVKYARPKEVVMALNEVMADIEQSARIDLSDDEDLEDLGDEGDVGLSEGEDSILRLRLVLDSYAKVMPRLTVTRSTPTLLSISDSLSTLLPLIADETDICTARSLLSSISRLVRVLWAWVQQTSDKGGEQRAILTQLLFMGVTLFGPRVESNLARQWFASHFPRYNRSPPSEESWKAGHESLVLAVETSTILGLSQADLIYRLLHASSTSPHSALAALILSSSSLPVLSSSTTSTPAAESSTTTSAPEDIPTPSVEDCMPILTAALSSSAIDAGLTWLWHLVHNGREVSSDNAALLLELLVPLAAMTPDPTARLLVFKLIGAIISAVSDPEGQASLFLQLLEPSNPFEGIRVQSLSLLRETITSDPPRITSELLHAHLAPILFTLPTTSSTSSTASQFLQSNRDTSSPPPLELPLADLMPTMYPAWFTDCANLLRIVSLQDDKGSSGVEDDATRLAAIRRHWLEPQLTRLPILHREAQSLGDGLDPQVEFVLDRWQDALERLQEVIEKPLKT